MRDIKYLVIHCSATPAGRDTDIATIKEWHLARGFTDVGYHYVIKLDGTVQLGRPLAIKGAHVKGHNSNSIGICYVGGGKGVDTRTDKQKDSLEALLYQLKAAFPKAEILGHRDFPGVTKECPSFNAKGEYEYI